MVSSGVVDAVKHSRYTRHLHALFALVDENRRISAKGYYNWIFRLAHKENRSWWPEANPQPSYRGVDCGKRNEANESFCELVSIEYEVKKKAEVCLCLEDCSQFLLHF